ncbi:MAG: hypothetical protein RI993_1175 [Pseudomonadota bacterium]|jgi:hypothetical protein
MNFNQKKILSVSLIAAALTVAWGNAQAHTRFEKNTVPEGTSHDNNVMIPHGCADQPVIGGITVFPDVTTALVDTSEDPAAAIGAESFTRSDQPATDFVQSVSIRGIRSKDTFSLSELISDDLGNPVGFWSADGSIPASNWVSKLPVRIQPVSIVAESCAIKVILAPAIANVCQVTSLSEIDGKDSERTDIDFWTAPDSGHPKFDAPGWNYPAPLTVTRNLETNPLPANCGDGLTVRIYPSAAQLDRDFPVSIDGQQVWPAP